MTLAAVTGCGSGFPAGSANQPLFVAECGTGDATTADLVLLEWGGGVAPLYPQESFAALDLSVFETDDGGTLADRANEFKERVRDQVTLILCDSPGPTARVRDAEDADAAVATVVYFTQAVSPATARQVGEGEYDTCNRQHDNAAVIFGEELHRLGRAYPFDEWVNVFANVTAHEIAHTLGFGHVSRDEVAETGRSLYVELMLDGHTMSELRREHRFLVDQTNCPPDGLLSKRIDVYPIITCSPVRAEAEVSTSPYTQR
jgi:hypothetical protein